MLGRHRHPVYNSDMILPIYVIFVCLFGLSFKFLCPLGKLYRGRVGRKKLTDTTPPLMTLTVEATELGLSSTQPSSELIL